MLKRCCANCVYATVAEGHWHRVMMRRFPGLRLCFNSVEAPGRMQEVRVDGVCPNFMARRWPHRQREQPPKPPNDEIRYIPLTHGLYATVDAQDYEKLSKYRWHARFDKTGRNVYAARLCCYRENGKLVRRIIAMHREILNPPEGMVIDHINGTGINNRRCNMRICTQAQNVQNRRPCPTSKSRFIGVFPRGDKWGAAARHKGKQHHVGTFEYEVEAARARDYKAVELFGEFARLNFPQEWTPQRRAEVHARHQETQKNAGP